MLASSRVEMFEATEMVMTDETTPTAPATSADSRVTILVIEPDALLRELIASGLALWNRRFELQTAADPEGGLERAAVREPDLVVTEIAFTGTPRREAFARLRARAPHAAWIVLTDSPAELFRRGFEYDALIAKPPEIAELGDRIERLLDRGRRSVVRGVSLPSFLQVLAADANGGTLEVRSRGESGTIGLAKGRVVHAEVANLAGREALFALLRLRDPVLTLFSALPERRTIDDPLPNLLLEFSVIEDDRAERGQRRDPAYRGLEFPA